jgi:hypothetical protein
MTTVAPLWASGPGEILRHGIDLLTDDTDTNRRLALISIDNSVELIMQTFIQLPKRITGLDLSRKQRDEICASFLSLLDGIENNASDKIVGINLGEIEWFHRLRNQLYHEGNGLTVERKKVEIYAELASAFFQSLFGVSLPIPERKSMHLIGEFIKAYASIEQSLKRAPSRYPALMLPSKIDEDIKNNVLGHVDHMKLVEIRRARNSIVHASNGNGSITPSLLASTIELAAKLEAAFPARSR